ncbi:MAG: HAD family hydrolase [Candidatus Methanofastidiosia archaeon]
MKAVTFDLWDTLIVGDEEYNLKLRRARLLEISEILSLEREEVEKAYISSSRRIYEIFRKPSHISVREQIEIFLDGLKLEVNYKILEKTWTETLLKLPPKFMPGTRQVLETLRDRNLKIGLISNTLRTPGKIFRIFFERIGIGEYFDHLTFSNEIGFVKPQPEIFRNALKNLKVKPHQTLHVGDMMDADIFGSKRVGMKTCLLENSESNHEIEPDFVIRELREIREIIEIFDVIG